jgi:hypothetical protein
MPTIPRRLVIKIRGLEEAGHPRRRLAFLASVRPVMHIDQLDPDAPPTPSTGKGRLAFSGGDLHQTRERGTWPRMGSTRRSWLEVALVAYLLAPLGAEPT